MTLKNISLWLPQEDLDELEHVKTKSAILFKRQTGADYIRLLILKRYGGVWIDLTTILLENLNWLDNLSKNKDVINKFGEKPDIFMFFPAATGNG